MGRGTNDPAPFPRVLPHKRLSPMEKSDLAQRMKSCYEDPYRIRLTRRTPVILRLDGKAFHSLTRHCQRPYDEHLRDCLCFAACRLCQEIQGAKCAYVQSDEISVLLVDFTRLDTQAWFDNNLQKMVSVAASICSVSFSGKFGQPGYFDCRAFNIPREEVVNYFIWRQKDCERNGVMMLAQVFYTPEQMFGKSLSQVHEMIHRAGENWAKMPEGFKNGHLVLRTPAGWQADSAPIFTQNRQIIEDLMQPEEG
uniref:tRNAHis guanylyltransferase catalytic domain-containing protein n=1 Tax=Desulfobacca acetoxidans TaxID=60893 RepID=A0A7C3WHF2_9BACT